MAAVRRLQAPVNPVMGTGSDPQVKKRVAPVSEDVSSAPIDVSDIVLPMERSTPAVNIWDFAYMIYGEEKIGKTTLANAFGQTFFFAFERGGKAKCLYTTKVLTHWEMALRYVELLEAERKRNTNFICLDTGHSAYDRCLEYICRRDKISHPGKVKDFGASWKEVSKEFQMFHSRLANMGGFIVTAHERTREREDRDGVKFDRIEPSFTESAELFYKAICDLVGYYHMGGDGQRYLLIQPTGMIHAGHRVDDHFLTPKGEPIVRIPMGNSSKESYINFKLAFDNRQTETFDVIREKGGAAKRKVA